LAALFAFVVTADIHHFDLAAFTFKFVVHCSSTWLSAKRADYLMCHGLAINFA
jgi:hypothetical protein